VPGLRTGGEADSAAHGEESWFPVNRARVLFCDGCAATTTDAGRAGAWFVFTAAEVPGNARCPECLPEQARVSGDLSCLR
jgi:hypothetical protein